MKHITTTIKLLLVPLRRTLKMMSDNLMFSPVIRVLILQIPQ